MIRGEMKYEGKVKCVYVIENFYEYVVEYKDDVIVFNV